MLGNKRSHLSLSGGLGPLHKEEKMDVILLKDLAHLVLEILLFAVFPSAEHLRLALVSEQNCACGVYKMFHCIVRST